MMRCGWCRRDGAGAVRRLETGDEWYHLGCWYRQWRITQKSVWLVETTAKAMIESEEIGPTERMEAAPPTLTIRPTGGGMTMAIPHDTTVDSGRGR